MQVPATTRMILSNFDNTSDYLKVANVLNNIVDTQRIFRIDSINTTEARFYLNLDGNPLTLVRGGIVLFFLIVLLIINIFFYHVFAHIT